MATVYLADDFRHQRKVAIKVVRPEISAATGGDRFLREIRLAARLHHPNILPLYDSGDADGQLYYVMPVAEGESLRDKLDREKSLPVSDAVRLAGEVATALDYAHRHEIVHRDIKPENILLHEGHALITDFGIGKAFSTAATGATLTQLGLAVGTPAYMSPEQAGGEPNLDGRTDLYSLGCVLYEMLAGEPAFTGPTVQAIIAKRFREDPPDATAVRPAVPRAVAQVTRKLMALEPCDRYATGAEAMEALTRSLTPATGTAVHQQVAGSETAAQSIAVLPFANMSGDAEDAYFADGITEEIINVLSQLDGLRVAARTSCFAFKGKDEDLRVVAEKLRVRHVLEGSVRKAGTRVRITAQLVGAADGYHLWSERYDRELVDIFAVQDELANAIAARLQVSLLPRSSAPREGPRNLEAYQLMLKGRALLWQRGRAILDAIPVLEQAVMLDPNLGDAQALLGDAWRTKWIYGMAPSAETIPQALAALDRALAIDPEQPQALAALANIRAVHDRDLEASLSLSGRVLARNPLDIQAVCERAVWLALRHDTPAAVNHSSVEALRTARRADPLNSWAAALESMVLGALERFPEAEPLAREAIALDPGAFTGRWGLVWILSALGKDDEAIATAMEALPMSGRSPRVLAELAALHARRGELAAVREILAELTQRASNGYIELSLLGCVTAAAGSMDEARALVGRGIAEHDAYFAFARWTAWAPFRADPLGAAMLWEQGY